MCAPDDIAVVGGVSQALDLTVRLLVDEGDSVLLEEPHYLGARRAFVSAGAEIVSAPVDADGLDLAAVDTQALDRCALAYVTPSHQFPTGAVLSLPRRVALLEWAARRGAFVIEDDYDSEFRYAGRSVQALKSLDEVDRVIYVGTLSKVLDPGLRLAYVVVPRALRRVFREAKWLADWASPGFEQEVLARFIESGEFERHVRRMRTRHGRQRDALLAAISRDLGDRARVHDSRTGLHVLLELPGVGAGETRALLRRALDGGVALYSATPYYEKAPPTCRLILGFTLPSEREIREGIAILAGLLAAEPEQATGTAS